MTHNPETGEHDDNRFSAPSTLKSGYEVIGESDGLMDAWDGNDFVTIHYLDIGGVEIEYFETRAIDTRQD